MFLYIQSFKLHSLIEYILLRYRKLHVIVNIRTSSLFQPSRSLILVFCITGWTQLEVSRFYQVFNQFKVSQAVFRGSLIDVRNDTKYRVHRLYTRALYCIPFHLKHAVLVKRRAKYVEVKWQESHFLSLHTHVES